MAKQLKGSGKSSRSKKKANGQADDPKPVDGEHAESGDNLVLKPKEVNALYKRFSNLANTFESARGEFMSDCKALYEEASDDLGIPRSIIRGEFGRRRAEEKRIAKEKEMEPTNREQLGLLREALGVLEDTPLGRAAVEREISQDEAEA